MLRNSGAVGLLDGRIGVKGSIGAVGVADGKGGPIRHCRIRYVILVMIPAEEAER